MHQHLKLTTWDYVTFVTLVAATASVGIYHAIKARGQKKTARDFLITNQDLGLIPLALSSVATYLSAVGMLGFPMETFMHGIQCFAMCFQFFLMIIPSCFFFIPVMYNLQIRSIFEYLEMRFNRFIRVCSSSLYIIEVVMYTACVIYAPSLALNQVTGLHLWGSVIAVGCLCIVYTALGGIKSVVWADAAQVSVMFIVLILLIVKGCLNVGGISEVWQRAQNGSRSTFAYVTTDHQSPYTIWMFLIGGTIAGISETVSNQMQVQRILCSPNLKSAYRIIICGAMGTAFIIFLVSCLGITIYATYADCDPLLNGAVSSRNQIVPLYGVQTLSFASGLPGIFVASLFCATLSTLSSSLNSLASITVEDYILPHRPHWSEAKVLLSSKIVSLTYGVVCVALVAVADTMGSLIQAVFMIFGAIGGPIFSLFFMGIMLPWVTPLGAFLGFVSGLTLGIWAIVGTLVTKPFVPSAPLSVAGCNTSSYSNTFFNVSITLEQIADPANDSSYSIIAQLYSMPYLWYAAATSAVAVVFGLGVSIITGVNDPNTVNDAYVSPVAKTACCYIHAKVQHLLRLLRGSKPKNVNSRTEKDRHFEEYGVMLPKSHQDCNLKPNNETCI